MGGQTQQALLEALARRQQDVVTREQMLRLGFSRHAIDHGLKTGRLHPIHRGVFALGRPQLSRHGEFMAAALRCGPTAALMGESAAALWQIRRDRPALPIEVSVTGSERRAPEAAISEADI